MQIVRLLLILLMVVDVQIAYAAKPVDDDAIYFRVRTVDETNLQGYSAELISLALEKTKAEFGDYEFRALQEDEQFRALEDLITNAHTNLIIEMSYDPQLFRSPEITYIPFPVDLGLMGYRACFVNPNIKSKIDKITDLDELKPYVFGHGIGWTDTRIMRLAGFKVIEQSSTEGLYRMVSTGRIDFFCRSIAEVIRDTHKKSYLKNLTLEDSFILNYPMPRFFYVNKKNVQLQRRLAAGLKMAYQDGSLEALWKKHYQSSVDEVALSKRLVFKLKNPLLSGLDEDYQRFFIELTAK